VVNGEAEMADFRIRFIAEKGFVSWAIRQTTFSEFSHVELLSEDGLSWIGAHAGLGVQARTLNYCTPSFERRYSIPVDQEQLNAGMAYARSKIGTPYNYADIAGLLFHRNISTKGRSICSQFVFDTFVVMGIEPLNTLLGYDFRVTPDILHLSPILIGHCYFETVKPS
jgi:uncharacterized protein YycO